MKTYTRQMNRYQQNAINDRGLFFLFFCQYRPTLSEGTCSSFCLPLDHRYSLHGHFTLVTKLTAWWPGTKISSIRILKRNSAIFFKVILPWACVFFITLEPWEKLMRIKKWVPTNHRKMCVCVCGFFKENTQSCVSQHPTFNTTSLSLLSLPFIPS